MTNMFRRTCGSVLALLIGASALWAGADYYRFEIVSTDHRVGSGVTIELRLTDLRTGQPVEGDPRTGFLRVGDDADGHGRFF